MEIVISLERGLAIFYFVCGLSLIVNPEHWHQYIQKSMERDKIVWGIISAFLGSFLVAFHNIWEFSPVLITTIIAWCALIKGVFFLTYPDCLLNLIKKIKPGKCFLRWEGVFSVVLAGVIYYYTF